jgi:predicted nucleotidyltransferase
VEVEELLKLLKEHKVRFVVIGATAFPVHGYSRATLDIDFFIEPTPRNAERTREALHAFGYDMSDVSIEDLLSQEAAHSAVSCRDGRPSLRERHYLRACLGK